MKVTITVKTKAEKEAVICAMDDPATRAMVLVMGTLLQLPTDRARVRVLRFVEDKLNDPEVVSPEPVP